MASRSSFWSMAPIRTSGISMGARRCTSPSIMRLVQRRPAVAAVPSVRAAQAVKVVEAAVALLGAERKPDRAQPQVMVEGVAVVLLLVVRLVLVPDAGMEAMRWPRVLKC